MEVITMKYVCDICGWVYDEDGETVLFIDSNEPDYSQFYLCSDPDCGTENVTDQMYNLTNEFDADSYHLMVSSEDWLDWDGTHYGSAIDPESLMLYFDAEYSQILEGERDEYGRVFMPVPFARDKDGNLLMNQVLMSYVIRTLTKVTKSLKRLRKFKMNL